MSSLLQIQKTFSNAASLALLVVEEGNYSNTSGGHTVAKDPVREGGEIARDPVSVGGKRGQEKFLTYL